MSEKKIKAKVPPPKGTWICANGGFISKIPLTGCPKCHEILIFNPEDAEDETKTAIEEQLNKLDINDIITDLLVTVIPPMMKETIEKIDTIEIEGKRVRIKFK